MGVGVGEAGVTRCVVREERYGALKLPQRRLRAFLGHLVPVVASLQIQRIGFQVSRASNGRERIARGRQRGAQRSRNGARDLVLDRKDIRRVKGWAYYLERRYDEAIASLKLALALDQRNSEARFLLAYAYLRKTMFAEAEAELLQLSEGPFGATKWGALGEVYGNWGKTQEAREALEKLDSLAGTEYVSPISRLSVYAGLGEWDRVLEQLELAYASHAPLLCLLKVDPRYDPIRPDPRVTGLLTRMHL